MTSTLSAALAHEHRRVDDGIDAFAEGDTTQVTEQQRAGLVHAITLLRRHIYVEETFLFPRLGDFGLAGPVMVMVHEHGQMWPMLDLLDEFVTAETGGAAGSLCRDLLGPLAAHNMKEERILYPQADELVPAPELDSLTRLLATTHVPDGWVCQGVPTR